MNGSGTMHIGPLGSTIHVLRADAGTIAELAAIDWSCRFRRVCLDPVRGLITLMSPSHLHEDLTGIFDHIVDVAGSELGGAAKGIRHTRLRGRGEPPGTGMEPDCAFYVGEHAREFRDVLVRSGVEAAAFIERVAPDLVDAVEGVRRSLTCDERKEAVARIVRRRRRASVRVREEDAPPYSPDSDVPPAREARASS